MTTIATDGETMAGDGLVTSGGTIFGRNCVKVFKLKDGRLVGIAGSCHDVEPFLEWLENAGDKPSLNENFEALVLLPSGVCLAYDERCRAIEEETPTATGSGREIALGAMAVGATAEEAVKAACERDTRSGGTITVLSRPRKLRRVA